SKSQDDDAAIHTRRIVRYVTKPLLARIIRQCAVAFRMTPADGGYAYDAEDAANLEKKALDIFNWNISVSVEKWIAWLKHVNNICEQRKKDKGMPEKHVDAALLSIAVLLKDPRIKLRDQPQSDAPLATVGGAVVDAFVASVLEGML